MEVGSRKLSPCDDSGAASTSTERLSRRFTIITRERSRRRACDEPACAARCYRYLDPFAAPSQIIKRFTDRLYNPAQICEPFHRFSFSVCVSFFSLPLSLVPAAARARVEGGSKVIRSRARNVSPLCRGMWVWLWRERISGGNKRGGFSFVDRFIAREHSPSV